MQNTITLEEAQANVKLIQDEITEATDNKQVNIDRADQAIEALNKLLISAQAQVVNLTPQA